MKRNNPGFTLIELLVVISIIGVLATLIFVSLVGVTGKARDTKRKDALAQIGRLLAASNCYMLDAGAGEYDMAVLFKEMVAKNPQYAKYMSKAPRDPKIGTEAASKYFYIVSEDGQKCALYANLENENEPVTLPSLTAPTVGGGTGVLKAASKGQNGTDKYFQISK